MTVHDYVMRLTQHCGLLEDQVSLEVDEGDEVVTISLHVPEEDVGVFIGHRGETLASIQRLVRLVFQEEYGDRKLAIDVNSYRQERQQYLEDWAHRIVEEVVGGAGEYRFPYLSSYERFIVHSAISNSDQADQVESFSEGEDRQRRLVVRLKS
ncbi:MAG TPA: R3H domain-containing nucleic acid-binding protein [Patescibacteria group bacterium]